MADTPTYPSPTSAELRARLDARADSIRQHLAALEHEVKTVADVTVNGQPLPDVIRDRPLFYAGLALAGGLALGLLWGLRARTRRRPGEPEHDEFLRLYVASVLEAAARRVARGEEVGAAIEKTLRRRPPLVHYAPPVPEARSTLAETFDVALKTALGFGVKTGLDRLAKRFTGEDELFSAVEEVKEEHAP
jgi:hypothetical protein